jgi:N-acetyl-gamma-glutamyl-phosphate reductase
MSSAPASTSRRPVGIVGASGYSGLELTRLLAAHPRADLRFLASDRWDGERVRDRAGVAGPGGELRYSKVEQAVELAAGCQTVFLATPAEASLKLVAALCEGADAASRTVIDLSGAFRLDPVDAYPHYYGFTHPDPARVKTARFGLPELFREGLGGAQLVANPGCYATSAILPLAPLLRAGLLADEPLVIDAASGTTGAGRKASEEFSFGEVADDFRAYRLLRHQHTPEIGMALTRAAGHSVRLTFTAHLLPVRRGILTTIYARLAPGVAADQPRRVLAEVYAGEPFIEVAQNAEAVALKQVVGTNRCRIGVAAGEHPSDPGRIVLVSALDNLLKGAAGQAVQNWNAVSGWGESLGLSDLRPFHP